MCVGLCVRSWMGGMESRTKKQSSEDNNQMSQHLW